MPLGADGVRATVSCVRDGMAQSMACARVSLDVDDGQPVHASHLETPESGHTGAGVGVASNVGLRENDLYAPRRSKTQCLTACRALRIRCIPWLSSEALSSPAPLPHPRRHVSTSQAVWRLNRESIARAHGGARMVQALPVRCFFSNLASHVCAAG